MFCSLTPCQSNRLADQLGSALSMLRCRVLNPWSIAQRIIIKVTAKKQFLREEDVRLPFLTVSRPNISQFESLVWADFKAQKLWKDRSGSVRRYVPQKREMFSQVIFYFYGSINYLRLLREEKIKNMYYHMYDLFSNGQKQILGQANLNAKHLDICSRQGLENN